MTLTTEILIKIMVDLAKHVAPLKGKYASAKSIADHASQLVFDLEMLKHDGVQIELEQIRPLSSGDWVVGHRDKPPSDPEKTNHCVTGYRCPPFSHLPNATRQCDCPCARCVKSRGVEAKDWMYATEGGFWGPVELARRFKDVNAAHDWILQAIPLEIRGQFEAVKVPPPAQPVYDTKPKTWPRPVAGRRKRNGN